MTGSRPRGDAGAPPGITMRGTPPRPPERPTEMDLFVAAYLPGGSKSRAVACFLIAALVLIGLDLAVAVLWQMARS